MSAAISLKMELEAVVSCLIWVLGSKLRSSARTIHTVYHSAISLAPRCPDMICGNFSKGWKTPTITMLLSLTVHTMALLFLSVIYFTWDLLCARHCTMAVRIPPQSST